MQTAGGIVIAIVSRLRENSTRILEEDVTPCDVALASAISHIVSILLVKVARMKKNGQGIIGGDQFLVHRNIAIVVIAAVMTVFWALSVFLLGRQIHRHYITLGHRNIVVNFVDVLAYLAVFLSYLIGVFWVSLSVTSNDLSFTKLELN